MSLPIAQQARGWLCAAAVCAGLYAGSACSADGPARVLVMFSGHRLVPAAIATEQELRATLDAGSSRPVEYYYEAVDEHRHPSLGYESAFVAYLAAKYGERPPDLILAAQTLALEFVVRHRSLWPDTPVVFVGIDEQTARAMTLGPNVTGITESVDWAGTLDLAARLQPDARRVVVVGGASEYDRRWLPRVDQALKRMAQGFEVTYLIDRSIDQLAEELARLPQDTIILHTTLYRDAAGGTFLPRDAAARLAAVASAPTYAVFSTFVGRGVVGGSVIDITGQGKAAAALALRILRGERVTDIPPAPIPDIAMVDFRQLERWGMSASRLPPRTVLLFREPSLWSTYRWLVIGSLLALGVQTALIVGLLFQRRRRRQAEVEAGHRRAELAQASRLALAGELTATIAHEINQPLGAILANAGAAEALLRRTPPDGEQLRQIVADIRKEDLRAGEIVRRVRGLVMRHETELEPLELNPLVADVLAFLGGEAARRGIAVETVLAPGLLPLPLDRVQLQQALVNLCVNAMDAMADTAAAERRLTIRTRPRGDGMIDIHVSDRGPGIPPDHLPRLFDSFFTTKPHGTGLGLSITRSIVEAHGGTLRAENRAGGGATFVIALPQDDGAAPVPRAVSAASTPGSVM